MGSPGLLFSPETSLPKRRDCLALLLKLTDCADPESQMFRYKSGPLTKKKCEKKKEEGKAHRSSENWLELTSKFMGGFAEAPKRSIKPPPCRGELHEWESRHFDSVDEIFTRSCNISNAPTMIFF